MHGYFKPLLSGVLLGVLVLGGCAASSRDAGPAPALEQARLYDGFGNYQRPVSTTSIEAQRWFDQGIQLLYGFNHDEAIRSFRQAAAIDPDCAMAWWGVAYAHGLHINNPVMTRQQSQRAYEAAQEALHRMDRASAVEQALIRALSQRYAWPIPKDRGPLDRAYANGMEDAWRAFPNDPDVGALYAESLMNLQPWDLWTKEGQPKGRTTEIVSVLEKVMDLRPDHPGANHFYIHAVEASPNPERAISAADRLGGLVPGSGHLVHMPAHIYARVGRWADASDANARAIAADRAYFELAPPPEFYSLYFVHNLHFLAYAAMMEGRYDTAMQAARELERDIPEPFLREWTHLADGFTPVTYHVMIRFGKWNDILAEPKPPGYRLISRAFRHYARGIAFSALGRTAEARIELAALQRQARRIPDDWLIGLNKAGDVLAIARLMLGGELGYREGRTDEAFVMLREAVALEDRLAYDEPPGWMQPVRHGLGALLMAEGRAKEAEQVYAADLKCNPHNGWSLLGLEQALRAQQRPAEADAIQVQLAATWQRADVKPAASCYCHPDAR